MSWDDLSQTSPSWPPLAEVHAYRRNPNPNPSPSPNPNPNPNPNQVHVDIDAYKSASIFTKLAKAAVGMVYPHVAKLTIDLAFMMAALTEDELPERIIGAARLQS